VRRLLSASIKSPLWVVKRVQRRLPANSGHLIGPTDAAWEAEYVSSFPARRTPRILRVTKRHLNATEVGEGRELLRHLEFTNNNQAVLSRAARSYLVTLTRVERIINDRHPKQAIKQAQSANDMGETEVCSMILVKS
jgi:hypothetical protein